MPEFERRLSTREVADIWGVGTAVVVDAIKKGELPGSFKAGGAWRVPPGAIQCYEEKHRPLERQPKTERRIVTRIE